MDKPPLLDRIALVLHTAHYSSRTVKDEGSDAPRRLAHSLEKLAQDYDPSDHTRCLCASAQSEHVGAGEIAQTLTGLLSPRRSFSSRSEEHTSELQSHSFISYAVFCLK